MSDERTRSDRDPHRRFAEWLLATADDEPPRDLAVHASVCPDCQRQIAALDMLTGIELGNAGMPPAQAAAIERRIGAARRVAVAVGGVAAVAAIGVGGWRLVEVTGIGALASESPAQEVLGNTGQPQATIEPSAPTELTVPASPSPSPSASATPPPASSTPGVTPVTLPPAATVRPTSAPTRTPRPSSAPPSPTPPATPTPAPPTPTPTPEPTPSPTPTDLPVAEAA